MVLARYSRDMDKQELHTRSHLVHHLRNTGLGEIAEKYNAWLIVNCKCQHNLFTLYTI